MAVQIDANGIGLPFRNFSSRCGNKFTLPCAFGGQISTWLCKVGTTPTRLFFLGQRHTRAQSFPHRHQKMQCVSRTAFARIFSPSVHRCNQPFLLMNIQGEELQRLCSYWHSYNGKMKKKKESQRYQKQCSRFSLASYIIPVPVYALPAWSCIPVL
jgi:hypothetical protein